MFLTNTFRQSKLSYTFCLISFCCLTTASTKAKDADIKSTPPVVFQTTDSMKAETRFVTNALETLHYDRKPISNVDTKALLRSYVEQFDPFHLFFIEPEVKSFESRFADALPFYLKQGNLFPAFEIFAQSREKSDRRLQWIQERLDQPFDLETKDTFTPDRRELPWPENEAEADILWARRLQYELLNEILGRSSKDESLYPGIANWKNLPLWTTVVATPIAQPGSWLKTLERAEDLPPPSWSYIWLADGNLPADAQAVYLNAIEARELSEKILKARKTLKDRYKRLNETLQDLDAADVEEAFLSALTRLYDPHSTFFSADSMDDFSMAIHNSFVGIGAVLAEEDGYCIIRELIPGGPASNSKLLKPGDAILGIAQGSGPIADVIGLKLRKIVRLIRGTKGTEVRLLIRPSDGDPADRKTISLIRDEVEITSSLAEARLFKINIQGKDRLIGVIDLPAFYGGEAMTKGGPIPPSTTEDVKELINKLKEKGAEGIILDIRRNGGGLLNEAITLTGLFGGNNPVLQVKDTLGHLNEYFDENAKLGWEGPLIILVSRYSASASEILAGALKDQNRALIVGDPTTHGKGTVQVLLDVDRSNFSRGKKARMGSAKITVQKWYRPSGESTQAKGVESDIAFPSLNPYLPIGESDLPHALPWDAIHSIHWIYGEEYAIPQELKQTLAKQSIERQEMLPEFIYLRESVDWFKNKQEEKSFALNLKDRRSQKEADEAFNNEMEKKFEGLDKTGFYSESIFLNSVLAAKEESNKAGKPLSFQPMMHETNPFDKEMEGVDIHLREALRIMGDWLQIQQQGSS